MGRPPRSTPRELTLSTWLPTREDETGQVELVYSRCGRLGPKERP